jgi:hypothetical protein
MIFKPVRNLIANVCFHHKSLMNRDADEKDAISHTCILFLQGAKKLYTFWVFCIWPDTNFQLFFSINA